MMDAINFSVSGYFRDSCGFFFFSLSWKSTNKFVHICIKVNAPMVRESDVEAWWCVGDDLDV